jgi:hypothetical protein
LERI